MSSTVIELEQTIRRLPIREQLWLIEQLVHSMRQSETRSAQKLPEEEIAEQLAAMALDPAIQAEL